MNTHYSNGKLVLEVSDTLEITLENEAQFEYRSHINRLQAINPNNWVSVYGLGNDGKSYKAWYFVENPDTADYEDIDYENPDDIENKYGKLIYDSEKEDITFM